MKLSIGGQRGDVTAIFVDRLRRYVVIHFVDPPNA